MAITISGDGITSANIADGTITNADINASAAIDASKLSGTGKVLQVVSDVDSTYISTTSTSNILICTVNITVSENSTIWLNASVPHYSGATSGWDSTASIYLYEGATKIQDSEHIGELGSGNESSQITLSYHTGAKSAGAYTYYIYAKNTTGTANHEYNRAPRKSILTAMEVSA